MGTNSSSYQRELGWIADIGLEIHVQLLTKSKLFSSDGNQFDTGDNQNISALSLGLPGALPVLNEAALDMAVKLALGLQGDLKRRSRFERKNYFYPDMPKNYQITQLREPFCVGGTVQFYSGGELKTVRIHHAHLEEDAGKSIHREDHSLINYNRAGAPLIEIVSEPDMHSGQEAAEFARMTHRIVRYLEICDGNLEEGSFRCDCNVSVRRGMQAPLGTKVEIKNLNSFRFIEKAIEYEIQRQIDQIEAGEKIVQQTRLYDSTKNITQPMRKKEEAKDYRYFPDPDLPELEMSEARVRSAQGRMPELPLQVMRRLVEVNGLNPSDAQVLVDERRHIDFFEATNSQVNDPQLVANWYLTELKALSDDPPTGITTSQFAELLQTLKSGAISGKMAKEIVKILWKSEKRVKEIIKEKGFAQITDPEEIRGIVKRILEKNPTQVTEFKSGKEKVFGFFVGQIMKESKGQASPDLVNTVLSQELKK